MNNSILKIVSVSEEKTSKDARNYKVVGFQPVTTGGLLSNQKVRRRTIWESGPNDSPGDAIYPHLAVGAKVIGSIDTVSVKPYYIDNQHGKFTNPETNMPANKVEHYTSVVFEGETIEQIARSQKLEIRGETIDEETGEVVTDQEVSAFVE